MKGFTTRVLSIVAIGAMAGSAVPVDAQEQEQAAEPTVPAKVAGTLRPADVVVREPTQTVRSGVLEIRDVHITGGRLEVDDPRLTGSFSVATHADVHPISDTVSVRLQTHSLRVENATGSWSGEGTSVFHGAGIPDEEATFVITVVLSGSDAYEGLGAYLVMDGTELPFAVQGVIFAGDLPPMPEQPIATDTVSEPTS